MNPTTNTIFPKARMDRLNALGLGIAEGKREGAYVYDTDGRRYVDGYCSAGTFNLGRRPPELAAELKQALRETDIGNFPMISREKAHLGQALAEFVPGELECSLFGVMRGEAVDAACKVARGFTGRPRLLSLEGGWHGQSGFALSLSQREDASLFGPLIPETGMLPWGDLEAARSKIDGNTAAVILEPIQAENYCREATAEYVRELAELCRTNGALLVFDETQTNFGRTGAKFAFEAMGVSPDILVLGEALGGGVYPITVTLMTQRVNSFLNKHPLIHLSTFGGADVGCRVAQKALELYTRMEPWKNAREKGGLLMKGIADLVMAGGSPIRGAVGKGLLISLDLVTPEAATEFCRKAIVNGLILLPGEVARHTVLLRPSLLITEGETQEILAAITAAAQ
ncbi:MAG TPA: aspartate aminotransferase family protein [Candidatus Hydrogenedentes bacterium]|nr:aspartate aminotransferase family protein [Candidatus Hydrogenedentota bacterium]